MASRLHAEALPALEPLALEQPGRLERARRASSWNRGALALDAAMLAVAALVSQLTAADAGIVPAPSTWLVVYGLLVVLFLQLRGAYRWRLRISALDDIRAVVASTVFAATAVLSLRILLPGDVSDLASQSLRLLAFSAVYVAAGRVALDWSQLRARRHGESTKPTLIVGAGRVGRLTAERLLKRPELGLVPVGFIDKEPLDEWELPLPVLGASWDLERLIEQHGVEHVIVTFSTAPNEVLLREARRCEELGIGFSLVPRLFERVNGNLAVEHVGGLPLLSTRRADPKGWQFALKYTVDRVAAAALLLLVAPIMIALALGTLLSLGRPIFFRQPRVGRDGTEFEMLKFRSMRMGPGPDEPLELAPDTAPGGVEGDDRRTALGSLMRRTSMDELPQLLNVLKGDMSLVGPRPERPDFARMFEESVYRYGDRHRVKSGITGWAQVHGLRGKTSLRDRVEWDNHYIEDWSLWLDVKIVLMTFWAVGRYYATGE
jgi:exopolysaccharide biosynthesis polyprenyl glycosylphosphotransferase